MLLSDVDLLRRLVAIDSTSAVSNLPIASELANYLEPSAESVEILESPSEKKANLLARFGPEGEGGLILSGHMDAVPAREPEWTSDPFVLTDGGDRWIGRGTADMKGFLAIAANAAASGAKRRAPLYLLFTYDEEAGTRGSKEFAERWDRARPLPKHCIIGEPTSFRPVRTHKGHLKLRLATRGTGAHSGYPHLGENAIEKMQPLLGALAQLRRALEGERPLHGELFPDAPFVPLNIGTIRGGSAVNVVPDHCEIEVGIRLLPGMSSEEMVERVRQLAAAAECEVMTDSPPMLLGREAEVYKAAADVVQWKANISAGEAAGRPLNESVNFASDAGWLQTLGIECLLFGPGSIEVAHRANEFVPKGDLDRAAPLVRQLIARFCA